MVLSPQSQKKRVLALFAILVPWEVVLVEVGYEFFDLKTKEVIQ